MPTRPYNTQRREDRETLDAWVLGNLDERTLVPKNDAATDKPFTNVELAKIATRNFERIVTWGHIRASRQRIRDKRMAIIPTPKPIPAKELPQVHPSYAQLLQRLSRIEMFLGYFAPDWLDTAQRVERGEAK